MSRAMNLAIYLLALALCAPAAADPSRGRKRSVKPVAQRTVALWNVRVLGIEESASRRVLYDLRQALQRAEGFRLLDEAALRRRLRRQRLTEDAPLEKVAPVLGAHFVLTGTLGGLGEDVSLDLRLLQGRTAREVRRVAMGVPMETRARRAVLDELLLRLFFPQKWTGALALDVSVDGAQVQLDGNFVATTPLAGPLEGLPPGKHILRITKEGFGEFSRFVDIRYREVARLKVDLEKAMMVGLLYEQAEPGIPLPAGGSQPAPAPGSPESGSFVRVAAWVFLGAGAAATGSGAYLVWGGDGAALGTVLVASGGTMLAGSLALFLFSSGGSAPAVSEGAQALSPFSVAVPGGLVIGLGGRF